MSPVLATWLAECQRKKTRNPTKKDIRSATKFNAGLPPLWVLNVLRNFVDVEFEGNHANGVGVRLSKDCTQPWNLVCGFQRQFLAVDFDVAFNPIDAHRLNLLEFRECDSGFVGEIETKLRRGDKRALLIDMVTQNLP